MQLRLGFSAPTQPVTLKLHAAGLRVMVECVDGLLNDARHYLANAGIRVENYQSALMFPAAELKLLARLPEHAIVIADPIIHPILEWVENPPDHPNVAELDIMEDQNLKLSWTTSGQQYFTELPAASTPVFVTADIPFFAEHDVFAKLQSLCNLPLLAGRAKVNRSGYVEIETSKPQLVEASNLRGVFRISDTQYGIPLPYLGDLQNTTGFAWEGAVPQLEVPDYEVELPGADFSQHTIQDAAKLAAALAAYRSQMVAWDPGLGRRVFVLAALASLDAWPIVVICQPHRVMQWWRHASLFQKTASVNQNTGDIRIVTYDQFPTHKHLLFSAQSLIFDDITSPAAAAGDVAQAANGVGGLLDCYLVGLTDELPKDPKELYQAMSRLRPDEFNPTIPLFERYGVNLRSRIFEHAQAYVSQRHKTDPGLDPNVGMFSHTQVKLVEHPDTLKQKLQELCENNLNLKQFALQAAHMASFGSRFQLSPKISVATQMASTAIDEGKRVAIVSKYEQTIKLLYGLLRGFNPLLLNNSNPQELTTHRLSLIQGFQTINDLTWFDEVILVDYPDSFHRTDQLLGTDHAQAPLRITTLHLQDSIDDQLATFAGCSPISATFDDLPMELIELAYEKTGKKP